MLKKNSNKTIPSAQPTSYTEGILLSFYVFILENLVAINLRCHKQNGGHSSAETLLLGGKFINFAYVSLITSACLNNVGTANKRCYGILQNKRNRKKNMTKKESLQLFEEKKVRTV